MVTMQIDGYEVEYSGEMLESSSEWGAYVALFLPSSNPMHMNNIFPKQRVSVNLTFPDEISAEQAAYKVAFEMVKSPRLYAVSCGN